MSPTPFSFHDLRPVPRSSMVSPYVNSLARLMHEAHHQHVLRGAAHLARRHLLLVQDLFVLLVGLDLYRLQLNHRCEGGCRLLLLLIDDM